MSRWEFWLGEQRKLVEDGVIAAKFTLEGPDGATWGTWPAAFPNIDESIQGILTSLQGELPKGKHACKLLAFDPGGQQLSCIPITIHGNSDAATEGAQTKIIEERAASLRISNFDKQFEALHRTIDKLGEHLAIQSEAHGKLMSRFVEIEERSIETRTVMVREEGKQRRLDEMLDQAKPLIGVAADFLAAFAGNWLEERERKPKALPPAPPPPGTSDAPLCPKGPSESPPAPPPPGTSDAPDSPLVQSDHAQGTPPSPQPVEPCPPRPRSQAGKLRPDGEGCLQGNGGSHPRRDGRKTPKPKQPANGKPGR